VVHEDVLLWDGLLVEGVPIVVPKLVTEFLEMIQVAGEKFGRIVTKKKRTTRKQPSDRKDNRQVIEKDCE